jgi:hypothetical protein
MTSVPLGSQIKEFHAFIGWFVNAYADLEYQLRSQLQKRCGLPANTFTVLFGSPRTSDIIGHLKKLLAAENLPDEAGQAIRDSFGQLSKITALRDRIVHHGGVVFDDGLLMIRSRPTDTSPETKQPFDIFESEELWAAAADLVLIKKILAFRLTGDVPIYAEPMCVRQGPWRYKPPGQRKKRKLPPSRISELQPPLPDPRR